MERGFEVQTIDVMETKILTGQADQKQIDAWKKENPAGIYALEAGGHVGYFRNPTRHDVNKAFEKGQEEGAKYLTVTEEFARLCCIGGSDQVLKNDMLFLSVAPELRGKMSPVEAKLVNL